MTKWLRRLSIAIGLITTISLGTTPARSAEVFTSGAALCSFTDPSVKRVTRACAKVAGKYARDVFHEVCRICGVGPTKTTCFTVKTIITRSEIEVSGIVVDPRTFANGDVECTFIVEPGPAILGARCGVEDNGSASYCYSCSPSIQGKVCMRQEGTLENRTVIEKPQPKQKLKRPAKAGRNSFV